MQYDNAGFPETSWSSLDQEILIEQSVTLT